MKEFVMEHVEEEWLPVLQEFPKIFLELSECVEEYYIKYSECGSVDNKSDMVNLRFGFEHDIGWKEIVRGFCRDMQDLADRAESNGDKYQYKGCIFKEKWGEFTPQGDIERSENSSEDYYKEYCDITSKWMEKSSKVCEICGKDGKRAEGGWIKVVCEDHEFNKN